MFLFEKCASVRIYALLILFSACLLVPFTGNVHLFDWDEINFAECAREMLITQSYHTVLLNFQAFWEKPPLFIWMQVLSMKCWGVNEFAARFPNIVNGILTVCVLYYFGQRWYSKSFGVLWAILHLGSFLPHLYFRSGIIDPWYNFFTLVALLSTFEMFQQPRWVWVFVSGISLGLAVLTKGPALALVFFLTVFLWLLKYKKYVQKKHVIYFLIGFSLFIVTSSVWFVYEYLSGNAAIIKAFVDYQIRLLKTEDSGHGGFLFYHFVVVFVGCFPASVLAIRYFFKGVKRDVYADGMMILGLVVLMVFSIVKTKIVHYSSMTYYSVSFLAAYMIVKEGKILSWQKVLLISMGSIIGVGLIVIGNIEYWKDWVIPYIEVSDKFAAENLRMKVSWYGTEFLCGVLFLLMIFWYALKKKYKEMDSFLFFGVSSIWIMLTLNSYIGKIEGYLQSPAVYFFQYCGSKGYAVDTYGYKSYAHLFYGQRYPLTEKEQKEVNLYWKYLIDAGYDKTTSYNLAYLNWLIYDEKKYPVFLVSKRQDEEEVLRTGKFKKLYSRGGYVFFMKQKVSQ